jgi:DNA-binding transcriptional ArsR family regulator
MKRVRAHPVARASDLRAARAGLIAPAVAKRLAAVFRSLSDPTRLRIISLVSEREFCVTDLAAALEMEQSTVSHQLLDMRQAGWVRYRREGRHVFYALDDEHVADLYRQALAHIGQG